MTTLPPLISKKQLILDALAAGDERTALRIAAAFPHLGAHREAITRGWAALQNPGFYRQLGQDPEALTTAGIAACRERYCAA